jgi:hypothetical protein
VLLDGAVHAHRDVDEAEADRSGPDCPRHVLGFARLRPARKPA